MIRNFANDPPNTPERRMLMRLKTKVGFLAAALTLGMAALPSLAQQQGDGGGGNPPADNGGGGGGTGRFNNNNNGGGGGGGGPQAWRQRMQDRFKQELGVSDEEMQALQPKIDQVMQLRRDSGGFGGGRPGRGGPGGGNNNGPQSDVQQKIADLQAAIDNKDAKPEEIKSKLDALRAAKTKAHEDLVKAQADLRSLLTQRQEAVLVMRGLLD
jgi:hypothetical protein